MNSYSIVVPVAIATVFAANPAISATATEIETLKKDIRSMQKRYDSQVSELEDALKGLQQTSALSTSKATIYDNSFNPSIGVILNGHFKNYSAAENELPGFAVGHEGERSREGLAVDHTELTMSANIDDIFFGSTTIAIAEHEGETEVELEEAFVQTSAGAGLPDGLTVKAGRALWTLGYLNEHHVHTDDFADRPLPYRVFLDGAYNDDGVEASYVLPTDVYAEVGGGIFRGDDFPFGEAGGDNLATWSAYARTGADIGDNQSFRVGTSLLSGEAQGERLSNEELVSFTGDTDLYVIDGRYTWAPTGNASQKEVIVQAEYFWRQEDGLYEDIDAATGAVALNEKSNGWYLHSVYKFQPQWRVGIRYSQLHAASTPVGLIGSALDADGHDPKTYSAMLDWTNSEFSRIRLQLNQEDIGPDETDNQVIVQYTMSLGAHATHKY